MDINQGATRPYRCLVVHDMSRDIYMSLISAVVAQGCSCHPIRRGEETQRRRKPLAPSGARKSFSSLFCPMRQKRGGNLCAVRLFLLRTHIQKIDMACISCMHTIVQNLLSISFCSLFFSLFFFSATPQLVSGGLHEYVPYGETRSVKSGER